MFKQDTFATGLGSGVIQALVNYFARFPRHTVIGVILLIALFAFELFNFDTTRYALTNLLGPVNFAGIGWATILALAFCSIDFAGLVRLFTPESSGDQPREVWYLMGAWLLGATMNALMTWWAVSLTLLNHDFGNEVLSRAQLLQIVPIFVAVLVWLTRILFIGALTVAGNHLIEFGFTSESETAQPNRNPLPTGKPKRERPGVNGPVTASPNVAQETAVPHLSDDVPSFLNREARPQDVEEFAQNRAGVRRVTEEVSLPPVEKTAPRPSNNRVRQRPPMPGNRSSSLNGRSRGRN